MEEKLPSPNVPDSGFLGFTSTPVTENHFIPKRGKKNRNDNWSRFGQYINGEAYKNESNEPYSNNPRGGSFNRVRGGFRHSRGYNSNSGRGRNQGRGHPYQQWTPQNHHWNNEHHHYQANSYNKGSYDNSGGYFHPSMLRDPWEHLEKNFRHNHQNKDNPSPPLSSIDSDFSCSQESQINEKILSDSMIPQVDDTLCERYEALNKSGDNSKSEEAIQTDNTCLDEDLLNCQEQASEVVTESVNNTV